jgi:hypothetical protein
MFGFGRPANEKAVINSFAPLIRPYSVDDAGAIQVATQIVDSVLADIRKSGADPFKTTSGNEFLSKPTFMEPRLAAGLSHDDVLEYWNRPVVTILGEHKVREYWAFVLFDIARQQGKDLAVFGKAYRRSTVRYGDPANWDPTDPMNEGLTEADADIYAEFLKRIDRWRQTLGEDLLEKYVAKHSSFNCAVRKSMVPGGV